MNKRTADFCFRLVAVLLLVALDQRFVSGQIIGTSDDLLDDTVTFSATPLQVERYVTLPDNGANGALRINSLTNQVGDPDAFYSVSQGGQVYRVADSNGQGAASLWFDANEFIALNSPSGAHGGLRSIAFHPEFSSVGSQGYGKFYGSLMAADQDTNANYLGDSGGNTDSVVAEWTFNHDAGTVGEFRELFRVKNPQFDHTIKTLKFNETASAGDSDYGLLYVAHGDGSIFNMSNGTGQDTGNALGKILRVNPLDPDGAGSQRYSVTGNQFSLDSDSETLAEIYSYGHRNPHNLTFTQWEGQSQLIVAEIGADLIDEVNIVTNGGDYGWGDREGTFERILDQPGVPGRGYGIRPDTGNPPDDLNSGRLLEGNDEGNSYTYPALQLDHNDPDDNRPVSIAGGPVIEGQYFFGNFAGNAEHVGGEIYSVSLEDLFSQNTTLEPSQTVDDLTWIDDHYQYLLEFDHDDDPLTPKMTFDNFTDLLSQATGTNQVRSDIRFGVMLDGTMLISNKRDGSIFRISGVTTAVPENSTALATVMGFAFSLIISRRKRRT